VATHSERREDPRKRLVGPASLITQSGAVNVRTLDISLTGMSVASPANVLVGSACTVDINLPASGGNRQRARLPARVVNCVMSKVDGFRLGLQFADLPLSERAALADCMSC
jgi:hypothetical protein